MEISKVRTIVNFFEDGLSKYMFKTIFPFITYNTKVFINYSYPSLSPKSVENWMNHNMEKPLEFDPAEN